MTTEEWIEVQEKLKGFYDIVKLKIDEYEVSIVLERIDQFKNGLIVYVNGKHLTEDCEERRRFYRPVTKSILSAKQKKSFGKLSKKVSAELESKTKYTYYSYYWTSFGGLKKHIIKNNSSIEVIK